MKTCKYRVAAAAFLICQRLCAQPAPEAAIGEKQLDLLAREIASACPSTVDTSASSERDLCAEKLGKISMLGDAVIGDSLRWGSMSQNDYNPAHNSLTLLNSLVWRKLYLSLFAFNGVYSVEKLPDESSLLRLNATLRPLPPSEYPYPFWHSAGKWRSYQQTREVGLLFKGGKLLAGYRNAQVDAHAPVVERTWNGFWTTDEAGQVVPRTSLYGYLLSPDNPRLNGLNNAYKAFATEARQYACAACHNPANPINMNPLVILNLPGQALSARHEIVYQLSRNQMPPGKGISDDHARRRLLRLAQDFETLGDRALEFETRSK